MIDCRESVLIVNKRGLHARASAKFVGHVAELPPGVTVTVSKDGISAAGGSILGLMMLGAAKGDSIEITCSGERAEAALAILSELVRGGFGEE
ncbi:HPr family phosphocarrier protein [Novosphingobium soli]|uniref:HPr family phosphocarrier protein n=1 Tax=Novosphingobium soli TaxID=574956 RepID=A0ABV6CQM5_9SPHN